MKQSNLALRAGNEFSEIEAADIAAPAPDTPEAVNEAAPEAQHMARRRRMATQRTRALGMDYRAITIGDDGLRLFRVR